MSRDKRFEYWTIVVKKDSWLYNRIVEEAASKRSYHRIPAMLRARLEHSYEEYEQRPDVDKIADKIITSIGELVSHMTVPIQQSVADDDKASTDDLDRMLDYFNAED